MKDRFHSVSRRSFIAVAGVVVVSFGLAACSNNINDKTRKQNQDRGDPVVLVVFAAASLTESLTEIGNLFKQKNRDVDIKFSFDSSGTLKTQIQEGARCDVFLSAGQKQMNALDAEAKYIFENRVVLCVAEGNRKNIKNFDDLATKLREGGVLLGMGNSVYRWVSIPAKF